MRHARRAGKRDANEHAVAHVARLAGWRVLQLDSFDLLCHRDDGRVLMVEVKSGEKSPLTGHQKRLIAEGWPLVVIRSVEEAEKIFGQE